MAIRDRDVGKNDTSSATHSVTLPGTVVSGDRLVVCFTNDTDATASTSSTGWSSLGSTAQGTNHRATIFTKVATGSDSLSVSLSVSQEATWVIIVFTGDGGTPTVQSNSGSAATTAPVTAITGLSSGNYDSVIFCSVDASTDSDFDLVATPPTNWVNTVTQRSGVTSSAHTYSADRALTGVTSVSPGDWTLDESEQWVTWNVAVAVPAAGGTVPVVRSVASNGEGNATTVAVSKPTGLAVGDYLLAFQESDADGTLAAMTAPSGFTELSSQAPTPASNIPAAKAWGKIAVQADVDASTFSFPDNTGSNCTVVLAAIQTGTYSTTTPVSSLAWATQGDAANANIIAPSITGVVDALLLTAHMPDTGGTVRTFSSGPAGMTLTHQSAAGNATFTRIGVYQQSLSSTSATGTKTAVLSATPSGWVAASLLINPASSTSAARRTAAFLQLL